jgi:hypothetical protein
MFMALFGLRAPGFGLRAAGSGLRAPGFGLRASGSEQWDHDNDGAKARATVTASKRLLLSEIIAAADRQAGRGRS